MARIAINGFGRIGRTAFKIALKNPSIEVVALNDLADVKTLAYLLKYDSNYGVYAEDISVEENAIVVNGKCYPVYSKKDPAELPLAQLIL